MKTITPVRNWVIGTTPEILKNIHQNDVNITVYNRNTSTLTNEVNKLLKQDIKLKLSGNVKSIINEIAKALNPDEYPMLLQDIEQLLCLFKNITNAGSFRLLLATINTNMCKRFHSDNNDLRMLCTYSGPGTLWLTEDNINRQALNTFKNNTSIVIDEHKIQQAKTGAVVTLKGAKYPKAKTKGAVHRSPTIEASKEKRVLLRIDNNEFSNF
ncbi:hypothetical protein MHTCC0001_13430 [Flavobacteriaceae bacterium MHTCC 0001]